MYMNVYHVSTWELNSFEPPVGPSGLKSRRSPEQQVLLTAEPLLKLLT